MIKIGDFAKIFNVSIKTIRFYEEKGLIDDYLVGKDDIMIYKDYVDDSYTGIDFDRLRYKNA